jgi:D-glycero-alpha-D-manno-heptose-7-phosphate kinase
MGLVLTRTPYRVSFLGGGTDYPSWYLENGGAVLSTTIDKYCYVTIRQYPKSFGASFRIVWRYIEHAEAIDDILNPPVREVLKQFGITDDTPLEIHYQGDLPTRSGIGSSSSFAVGLANALLALRGERADDHNLALHAIELEQNRLGDTVGSQDQMAVAYGGLNIFRFERDGSIQRSAIEIDDSTSARLEDHLVIFYTGSRRRASRIAETVVQDMKSKRSALQRMMSMVEEAVPILQDGRFEDFGALMHEAWMLKRSLSSVVSNSHIDGIYDRARAAGAYGGKLMGAGSSGFVAFIVPPERRPAVISALATLRHVPVGLDRTGTTVLYAP